MLLLLLLLSVCCPFVNDSECSSGWLERRLPLGFRFVCGALLKCAVAERGGGGDGATAPTTAIGWSDVVVAAASTSAEWDDDGEGG